MLITGIILAGGKSSRMGRDKGFVKLGNENLIDIAIRNLSIVCSEVVISANHPDYENFGLKVVRDQYESIGPMGGLYSAIHQSSTPLNLVLSVDLPFVNTALLNYLVSNAQNIDVVVPVTVEGRCQPLCAVYNRSLLPVLEDMIIRKDFTIRNLFTRCNVSRIAIAEDLPFFRPELFMNINTLSDLEQANTKSGSSV